MIKPVLKSIINQQFLDLTYKKKTKLIKHKVRPIAVSYHEHALYLIGSIHRGDKFLPDTANFRIDRIEHIEILKEKFRANDQKNYFSTGEYEKHAFNMFSGKETKVTFKALKRLEEYAYREFPTAKKIAEDDATITMEVTVLSTTGILFWILSQQNWVEVIGPKSFREEIKVIIRKMENVYKVSDSHTL